MGSIHNIISYYWVITQNMSVSSGYQSIHSLVDLKRLSHLLKSLSNQEIETLEILMDNDALDTINQ